MSNLLNDYHHRRSYLDNINYDEGRTRLIGFYDWLLSEPEITKIINKLKNSIDINKITEGCGYSHGPQASTPDEITSLAIFFLDKIKDGVQTYNLCDQYGIHSIYDSEDLQSDFEEMMDKYINPAFDFIEQKIEEIQSEDDKKNIPYTLKTQYPLEITQSLKLFEKDHPNYQRNVL